jgi:hypothetical protein
MGGYLIAHLGSDPVDQRSSAPRVRPMRNLRHLHQSRQMLHHTTTRTASAFDNAPVTVLLAVLPSPCESQVHGPRFYARAKSRKEGRSSLHPFPPHRPLKRFSFRRQNSKIGARVGKVGLAGLRSAGNIPRWWAQAPSVPRLPTCPRGPSSETLHTSERRGLFDLSLRQQSGHRRDSVAAREDVCV